MQIKKINVSFLVVCLVPMAGCLRAAAQQAAVPDSRLTFEVATIRISKSLTEHESINISPGGRFQASMTVRSLIERAYGIRDFQLAGGPKWLEEKYEIIATSDEPADMSKMSPEEEDQLFERDGQRMRALLQDRFQFRFHRLTKQESVYALVVAKGGPKLNAPKPSERHRLYTQGSGRLACYSASMAEFVDELNEIVEDREVVDRTGLNGRFDFSLKWTPDELLEANTGGDQSGPSLFTALQEQLGLKLQSARGPIDLMVIDQIKRPSEN
jgi:uncharacterized protein (TIGR03435 family)